MPQSGLGSPAHDSRRAILDSSMARASIMTARPAPPVKPARLVAPLKWAGGKRWQMPHVRPIWEAHRHRRMVEPFCGGLAVTLGVMPERALLNDINPHLINFYRWLKRGLRIELPLENDAAIFYAHRARFNDVLATGHAASRDCASLFYYLNRTGYNGLCRFNRAGFFNVPFGKYKKITYLRDFSAYREILRRWTFVAGDFERLPLTATDFIYADPPYDVDFTSYAREGFSWIDQVRTAEWLARHEGPVILVNQATARVLSLYRKLGYDLRLLKAPRRISCTGDRTPAEEVFATRNL
jgi:DNA adenine methylase